MLIPELTSALRNMIGVRADVNGNELAESFLDLKKSTTGITLDACHELLQLDTLKAAAPIAMDDTRFAKWLYQTRDDAIIALLNALDTKLTLEGLTPQMMASRVFFVGSFGNPPAIVPSGRTVGLELIPIQTDVTVMLQKVTFFATFPAGFKLTLTDRMTGVAVDIPVSAGKTWVDADIPLLADHAYELTYSETDLQPGGMAYNTLTGWPKPKANCNNCKMACPSSYVQVTGMQIDGLSTTYTTDTNFGLNITLSAKGDVSPRLLMSPGRLLSALREQMAVSFLSKIAYSKRLSGDTENAKEGALWALGDVRNEDRKTLKLQNAISAVVKSMKTEASATLDVSDADEIEMGTI